MLNGGSMEWGFCVYFVYIIPLETDVLRKHRFQKSDKIQYITADVGFIALFILTKTFFLS